MTKTGTADRMKCASKVYIKNSLRAMNVTQTSIGLGQKCRRWGNLSNSVHFFSDKCPFVYIRGKNDNIFYQNLSDTSTRTFKGKQLWNKAKFKLIRKRKNKLTNGQCGMIIQLRAAIFAGIRNVQIQALQTVFISFLSLPFLCVFHLWFKYYRRHIVYSDVTRDSVTCSFTLVNVYVGLPVTT